MVAAVVALIIALLAAGGAIFAIFKATALATRRPAKKETLPEGQYLMKKVPGTEDTYDLIPLESTDEKEAKKDN